MRIDYDADDVEAGERFALLSDMDDLDDTSV